MTSSSSPWRAARRAVPFVVLTLGLGLAAQAQDNGGGNNGGGGNGSGGSNGGGGGPNSALVGEDGLVLKQNLGRLSITPQAGMKVVAPIDTRTTTKAVPPCGPTTNPGAGIGTSPATAACP